MADRKAFLLRIDPVVLEALQKWAADDLRSLNGQVEYLLRGALLSTGRLRRAASQTKPPRDDSTKEGER